MTKYYSAIINTPLGKIGFTIDDGKVAHLKLIDDTATCKKPQNAVSQEVADEISAYFSNPKYPFKIPLVLEGTPFQQKVWQALRAIPCGETRTYGQLAKQLRTGPRAIGQACRTNRILLMVPCHRVVAGNNIGGFGGTTSGRWKEVKTWLLEHEGIRF